MCEVDHVFRSLAHFLIGLLIFVIIFRRLLQSKDVCPFSMIGLNLFIYLFIYLCIYLFIFCHLSLLVLFWKILKIFSMQSFFPQSFPLLNLDFEF